MEEYIIEEAIQDTVDPRIKFRIEDADNGNVLFEGPVGDVPEGLRGRVINGCHMLADRTCVFGV